VRASVEPNYFPQEPDGSKITAPAVTAGDLLFGKHILLRKGKKITSLSRRSEWGGTMLLPRWRAVKFPRRS
jgi:hypothetical protein